MNTSPPGLTTSADGRLSVAVVPGPPSPENDATPVPATVWIVPPTANLRTRCPAYSDKCPPYKEAASFGHPFA